MLYIVNTLSVHFLSNLQPVVSMFPWFRLTPQFGSPTMRPAPRCVSLIFHISAIWRRPIHPQTAPTRRRGAGHDSRFLFGFEPNSIAEPNITGLGLGGWDSIRGIRAKFSRNSASFTDSVAICHNMWGLQFWPTSCRHSGGSACSIPIGPTCGRFTIQRGTARRRTLCQQCAGRVGDRVPAGREIESRLIYPVDGLAEMPTREPLAKRPVVIGWVGRMQDEQKRVERLPAC